MLIISNKSDFQDTLNGAGNKLVVVDFTAQWCGPCQVIGPYFQQLSEDPKFQDVIFFKVDVDEADELAAFCNISCMPTFHFYKNGKKIDELSGANQKKLLEKLEAHK